MLKTINVTKHDLLNGEPGYPEYCPVALAVKRHVNDYAVSVPGKCVYIFGHRCEISEDVQFLIDMIDLEKEVKPFKFKLDIPDHLLKRST